MALRGVVGIFFLSAVPLVCLELRRGIPDIEEEEKNEKRQKLVRKKQQETQGEKVSRYIENVLKPHQEMKLKKLEERFYQMTGEAWKLSSGHKLGGDESTSQTSFETSNRETARSQNLPKPFTEFSLPAEQPTRKEIPDLPEEPTVTAEEVVTVALRCPSGSVLRRRFLKSCSSQTAFGSGGRPVAGGHWNNCGHCTHPGREGAEQLGKKSELPVLHELSCAMTF
ncbi:UBX domain-containing protein 8 isoform X2 [Cebus imitator]|uniref:UBX domain-containing protein 8 isoform X2 n=1 Tax=Cebus imitator TaxID=2715852 RepID=UPI00080A24DE|nr:UBX domain-containing protein 8 isoform X2 [Cebus imitator]